VKQSVRIAVLSLEHRIQTLNDKRTRPHQKAEAIAKLDAEIAVAERELAHFRAALKHEQQLLAEDGRSITE